ncbi:MAG: type II secretion system protein GspD, partial [Rikenellaceae bacterium]
DAVITCNFSRAKIVDLIYFVCKEYSLDLDVVGNIVSIFNYSPPPVLPPPPLIKYDSASRKISYELLNHNLSEVSKMIANLSGVNVIVPQTLYGKTVSGFVKNMAIGDAIITLASTNKLITQRRDSDVWEVMTVDDKPLLRRQFAQNQLVVDSIGLITANLSSGNIGDIIVEVCDKLGYNYFFINAINQQTSLFVKNIDFETLLNVMFTGSAFGYYVDGGVYLFGNQGKDNFLGTTKIYRMNYRTVTKIVEIIPQELKKGVQVQMFSDLNSIIVSGDSRLVSRVVQFLQSIDESVPMITMDIMIVDVTKSVVMEAGITMGFGEKPIEKRSGTISAGVNLSLGPASVNNLINSFNGLGVVNLGKVSDDFYASLKFLEGNGNIELRSTPKLSTLNGHEATMKSGETKYYKEVLNNIIGSQNPIQSESFTWKSVEANLSVKITPLVSSDCQITLDVEIEQSEFTAREEKDAPPGTVTRKFKSIIRVKNEDMVLLGGLERNSHEKSSSGVPFIARIPVLKWLFGTTKNNKSTQKLNIFIKPTLL